MSVDKLRFFWVMPADESLPLTAIDAPPDIWQDKITGARIKPELYHKFIKVVELPESRSLHVID